MLDGQVRIIHDNAIYPQLQDFLNVKAGVLQGLAHTRTAVLQALDEAQLVFAVARHTKNLEEKEIRQYYLAQEGGSVLLRRKLSHFFLQPDYDLLRSSQRLNR